MNEKDYEMQETIRDKTASTSESYEFRANYPDQGSVLLKTYSVDGDVDDIVTSFHGFLLSLGFSSQTISESFKREF